MNRRWGLIIILVLVIAVGLLFWARTAADTQRIQIKWLQSHQPTAVFEHAEKVFADELSKDSSGGMELIVITPHDVGVEQGDVPQAKIAALLDSRQISMATAYTVALGQQDPVLWSLNLPFLFSSYDDVPKIVDGDAGKALLNSVKAFSNFHALAFTMSGGFRIIASNSFTIHSIADLKGKHIATSGGPVAEATLAALGAVPVSMDLESGNADISTSTIDGIETTYSRLSQVVGTNSEYTRYISETNHSMFFTAIIMDEAFFTSLSPHNQQALTRAAQAAALVERQDSIALAAQTKATLQQDGSTIVALSPENLALFKPTAQQPVFLEFGPKFGPDLMGLLGY